LAGPGVFCDNFKYYWYRVLQDIYPHATAIMLLCDGGGSNSSSSRLFKQELIKLSEDLHIDIIVAHYPPYTSKWNPIEHRLFSQITRVWSGISFESVEQACELAAEARTKSGLCVFTNINSTIVDPKNFDPKNFVTVEDDCCIIPPNSFALARTVEYFRIPRNVLTVCLGKSTYARCGIIVNVTPFEPEWEGYVTLEFSNTTPLPAKIYAGEGVAQVLFFESDEVCETSYKDRKGKYMGQTGVTLPKA